MVTSTARVFTIIKKNIYFLLDVLHIDSRFSVLSLDKTFSCHKPILCSLHYPLLLVLSVRLQVFGLGPLATKCNIIPQRTKNAERTLNGKDIVHRPAAISWLTLRAFLSTPSDHYLIPIHVGPLWGSTRLRHSSEPFCTNAYLTQYKTHHIRAHTYTHTPDG